MKMPHKKIIDKLIEIDGWIGKRRYPFWKQQFEMLYDDIKDGKFGEEAKTGKFFTATDKIKTDNPKPKEPDKLKKELKELEKKYGTEDNA